MHDREEEEVLPRKDKPDDVCSEEELDNFLNFARKRASSWLEYEPDLCNFRGLMKKSANSKIPLRPEKNGFWKPSSVVKKSKTRQILKHNKEGPGATCTYKVLGKGGL